MKPTHAMMRAMERCPGICPGILIRRVCACVVNGDESSGIKFITRIRKEQFLALFHFRLPSGLPRYAVCCCASGHIVTFLEPGHTIWTCRGTFMLGEHGLEAAPKITTERKEQ